MNTKNLITSSYFTRYLFLNAVDILDYKVFPERTIQNSPPVFNFHPMEDRDAKTPLLDKALSFIVPEQQELTMDQFLEQHGTVAFLVIKNDRILLERYYNGYSHSSICTSFSTVKSFVSAMVGIALQERLIHGLDDTITKYLPELKAPYWSEITIRHLVSMSSGLKYSDGFLPWSDNPRVYYTLNLRELASKATKEEQPGIHFHYNNYNLVLLGMVLDHVTGSASIPNFSHH